MSRLTIVSTIDQPPRPRRLRRRCRDAFAALAVTVTSVLLVTGCNSPFFKEKDYLGRSIDREELREIEAVDLAQESLSPPVTVEQAAEDVLRALVTPTTFPDRLELTIADVRAAALQNNLDLAVEVYNPLIAEEDIDIERARFESTFTGSARRSVVDSPTSVETEGSQSTVDSYSLGVDVPLRTGGFARVELPFSSTETNNPFSTLNPAYTSDLRFSISQPLLRDAGVNTNTHLLRVARYQAIATSALTKLESIRILAEADRVYWALYAARGELDVRQNEYELAVAQLERSKRRVDAGDVAPIEVTRAESGVAASLQNIIVAQTAIRRNQRDLKRIMNRPDIPLDSPTEIVTITPPQPVGLELDAQKLADYAVANRMEMLELELQLAADASAVDFQRNQKLPLVTLDYSYSMNGLGTSYHRSFDQLSEKNFEDWSVGVDFRIPLGNEAAESRYHQAVLTRLQRLATREQRTASIRQEVYDALDLLEQNWQRILAARLEALLEGRTFQAEQRQFEVGVRTSTDVLEAAARLANAQSEEVRALADYQVALVDIAFATGTLLGSDNVRWDADNQSLE